MIVLRTERWALLSHQDTSRLVETMRIQHCRHIKHFVTPGHAIRKADQAVSSTFKDVE